jgi:hypothetical protein
MELRSKTFAFATALGLLLSSQSANGDPTEIVPIDGQQASILGMVTGIHSLRHKRSGLEVRVLEADGSASVAEDPIALFLVVTNGTSDLGEHVWRLPRGVDRVRRLSETACGIDASVEIDGHDEPSPNKPSPKPVSRVFHLCFLTPDGQLLAKVKFSDSAAKRAG